MEISIRKQIAEKRKNTVITYLHVNCKGHRNARHLKEIVDALDIDERLFRKIFSELRDIKLVASTVARGYWEIERDSRGYIMSREERTAVIEAWQERKGRAVCEIKNCDRAVDELLSELISAEVPKSMPHDLFDVKYDNIVSEKLQEVSG